MNAELFPNAVPALIAALLAFGGIALSIWRRKGPGAWWLTAVLVCIAVWSIGHALELISETRSLKQIWLQVQATGAAGLGFAWLGFAMTYSGMVRDPLSSRFRYLLAFPLLMLLFVWSNGVHHLVWDEWTLTERAGQSALAYTPQLLFWVFALVSYGLILTGVALILWRLFRSHRFYRKQGLVLLAAFVPAVAGNLLYLSRAGSAIDTTTIGFLLTGVVLLIALVHYRPLALLPLTDRHGIERESSPILVLDAERKLIDFNAPAEQSLGLHDDIWFGRSLRLIQPEIADIVRHLDNPDSPPDASLEIAIEHEESTRRFIVDVAAIAESNHTLVTLNDVTERRQIEQELQGAQSTYQTLVDQVPAVIYKFDLGETGYPTYISSHIQELLGYPATELLENRQLWIDVIDEEDRERVLKAREHSAIYQVPFSQEYRLHTRDGQTIWIQDDARVIRDEAGLPLFWQGILVDITGRKSLENRLSFMAYHDPLTRLPNRAMVTNRIQTVLRSAAQAERTIAVIMIDLDNFKDVNDTFGHERGDQLLVDIAHHLTRNIRSHDMIGRLGGDEFLCVISGVQGRADVERIAGRLLSSAQQTVTVEDQDLTVTASIGIALNDLAPDDPDQLIRHADVALNHCKQSGKNRFDVYEPSMAEHSVNRLVVERDIRKALEADQFVLHYQPVVNLSTGTIEEVETLLRWEHPDRGLLEPGEFIGVSEESGLIVQIGYWVLEQAFRDIREWDYLRGENGQWVLNINLSARQFQDLALFEHVSELLDWSGLAPSRLKLEVNETIFIESLNNVIPAMRRLRALGVRFAIDDFGTGYSSLSYLKQLPVDTVKIDGQFIQNLASSHEDRAIVRSIVTAARGLGMQVTAEGVEESVQVRILRRLDCTHAQGYAFSRPISSHEIGRLLRESPALLKPMLTSGLSLQTDESDESTA